MSKTAKENGEACAYPSQAEAYSPEFGFTKREELAARMHAAILANPAICMGYSDRDKHKRADMALREADALIAALAQAQEASDEGEG